MASVSLLSSAFFTSTQRLAHLGLDVLGHLVLVLAEELRVR